MKILRSATFIDPAMRFAKSAARWAYEGFPTPGPEAYRMREKECAKCPHWDPAAFGAYGKCKICGCSKLKLKFKTASCPMGKW